MNLLPKHRLLLTVPLLVATLLLALGAGGAAQAARGVLVLSHGGDGATLAADLQTLHPSVQVDHLDGLLGTPSLAILLDYRSLLVYTDNAPLFPDDLGDVLADYVDAGGILVIATYGFSAPFGIAGRITTTGYAPLVDSGANGAVTGSVVALVPGDRVFNDVAVASVQFTHNANYAHPTLDTGASLLADDGGTPAIPMIARSADGKTLSVNIYPEPAGLSADGLRLLSNALTVRGTPSVSPVWVAVVLAIVGFAVTRRRGRA